MYRTQHGDQTGPSNAIRSRDVAAEQKGCGLGALWSANPSVHVLLEKGTVWGSPRFKESQACGHRRGSFSAAWRCSLRASSLWQAVLEKAFRVDGVFLSKARAVSSAPLPHPPECALPGGEAPSGGRCAQPAAPQRGELTNALCFPSFGRFLPQCWALGAPASGKVLSLCPSAKRRTVGRREEVGLERRGLGFAFTLRQQLPRQDSCP